MTEFLVARCPIAGYSHRWELHDDKFYDSGFTHAHVTAWLTARFAYLHYVLRVWTARISARVHKRYRYVLNREERLMEW